MKFSLLLLIFILLLFGHKVVCQDQSASAIIELKKSEYNIISTEKTILRCRYRIAILNEAGEKYINIEIPVNGNARLLGFSGSLYDSKNKKVRKISKSDLYEVSNFEDYSLYSDSRMQKTNISYYNFPCIVDYNYELEIESFPGCYWFLIDDYDLPVKSAELTIKSPKESKLNYRTNNFKGISDTIIEGNMVVYRWKAENIKSISREDYSPGLMDLIPSILVAPVNFQFEGYSGNNDSWENYGKWVWDLVRNRQSLPSGTVSKILQLTDPLTDTLAKMKCIYKYFQANTRYISIQKGIGGFQPVSAAEVDDCKYGDCKALSNYLSALLSIIGIRAVYTEIGNGNDRKIKWIDFPGFFQTNHVIVAIPYKGDTIWLESTNKDFPFGYIGEGNSGRKAIFINEGGGTLVNTPEYPINENSQVTDAAITVNKDGSMKCIAICKRSGYLMDDLIYLKSLDKKEQRKFLYKKYPSNNLEIIDFKINETEDLFPEMKFQIEMQEPNFMLKTGNFYSFKPNYLEKFSNPLVMKGDRINDICLSNGFVLYDTINFVLPGNFIAEYLPDKFAIESTFGKYFAEYTLMNNNLLFVRAYSFNGGTYTKEKYAELNEFFEHVQAADNPTLLFREE